MIEFFMPMRPPTVTHHDKELHAYMKGGKPCAVLHDSPALKDAKSKLRSHLAPHRNSQPVTGPVMLVTKWCFPIPPGSGHRDGEYKTTKPDADNLQKALKDQMTRLGFWKDDAQVVCEICEKFWADVPGVYVCITELEDNP